jgi:hypothetical protein
MTEAYALWSVTGMTGPWHLQVSQARQQETSDQPAAIPLGDVHLCDINPGMLQEGVKKAAACELGTKIALLYTVCHYNVGVGQPIQSRDGPSVLILPK